MENYGAANLSAPSRSHSHSFSLLHTGKSKKHFLAQRACALLGHLVERMNEEGAANGWMDWIDVGEGGDVCR